ncbi:MAG: hypothetical protein M3R72_01425 [Bacteroidota bacterium]|nr:hypothetical protein [Bacteroidota bacterium]
MIMKILSIFLFIAINSCHKNTSSAGGIVSDSITTDSVTTPSLFQKYSKNPLFTIGNDIPVWRSIHAANVSLLAPQKTGNGKWLLFMRGSGNDADGYHDNIGRFEQDSATFNPLGAWTEADNNPVLTHGTTGTYDAQNVLDEAALVNADKTISMYYMGRDANNRSSLCLATSATNGFGFAKYSGNPLKEDVGPNDVVLYNNNYYVFYGDAKWNGSSFDEPLQIWLSLSPSANTMSSAPSYALQVGGFGSFDIYSVNGAKIFKVTGDERWFMLYQCSFKNFDYPERFHCAYSSDLIHWTKVANTKPLLTRGKAGEFDQGAIWTGSVIEYNSVLYIYYEGWGSFTNDVIIRDNPYYTGGNSRVGIASCTTASFLSWAK